jgi:glutamate-1-semialdehyde 2,1-aminomutase
MSENDWTERAQAVLPAGGFGNFDPSVVIERGVGSRVWDTEGKEYIDYLIGSGPMILGHGHPEVLETVREQLENGTTFFANNTKGIELAEVICEAMACADKMRFVSTGGEADMFAMRLARAYTGREKIVKFEGGYHGMSAEAQMSLAPDKLINFPQAMPDSAGILQSVRDGVLVAPFNDEDFITSLLDEHGDEIAGMIVEPLQRTIAARPGYLQHLRDLCTKHGIVLIFDEVVTGFRFAYGGAQEKYGITPDLCTLGKAIGGGFPSAAIAGKEEIMAHFDKAKVGPEKWLMQLGTLSGNPLAAAAGLKTLEILRRPGQYEKLYGIGRSVMTALTESLSAVGIAHQIVGNETMFDAVFTDQSVRDYRDIKNSDTQRHALFNKHLRANGIFKYDGKFYMHLAITETDLEQTVEAFKDAANKM